MAEPQYLLTLGVMLGVVFLIANLMVNVRRQTEAAAERERRTALLFALSRELAVAADAITIADVAARHVASSVEGLAIDFTRYETNQPLTAGVDLTYRF